MKSIKIFAVLFLLICLLPINFAKAQDSKGPIIVNFSRNANNQPLITGLSPYNSEVLVYVDGLFVGVASVNREGTATDNFSYTISKTLSQGKHTARVVAKDRTSLRLSNFSNFVEFETQELSAPTLLKPNRDTITQKVKPLIIGLSRTNTKVKIFVDGVLNGETEFLNHKSGTANFAYQPFLNLNVGWHTAWATAVDQNGNESKISNILHFRIEEKFPAPTLIRPSQNETTFTPTITGLAKNDSKISIFVDYKLQTEFSVINHESGTANFAYHVPAPLSYGQHVIYATAKDNRGKESIWSNIIFYTPIVQKTPGISDEGVSEENLDAESVSEDLNRLLGISRNDPEQKLDIGDLLVLQKLLSQPDTFVLDSEDRASLEALYRNQNPEEEGIEGIEIPDSDEIPVGTGTLPGDLEDILMSTSSDEEASGLLNEQKDQQNKIKLNLVIFFLFLIAVIVWIFWVNRELIKEKAAESDQDKK